LAVPIGAAALWDRAVDERVDIYDIACADPKALVLAPNHPRDDRMCRLKYFDICAGGGRMRRLKHQTARGDIANTNIGLGAACSHLRGNYHLMSGFPRSLSGIHRSRHFENSLPRIPI
jgi:hypothetical protein